VWVRDHDRNEAAFGFDLMGEAQSGLIYNVLYRVKQETHKFNGLCIKQSNQVPEDITILRLEQHSALTDAELGLCGNGPDTRVDGIAGEGVVIGWAVCGFAGLPHGGEGRPLLT